MTNYFKRRSQSGDTIVEVLIVLTVLSLAFAISYATANKGLNQSRNAEEHSQALGVLNSQVELVRTAVAQHASGLPANGTFCVSNNDVTAPASFSPITDPANYPSGCQRGFYKFSATPVAATSGATPKQNYYDFKVTWDGIGDLGTQQEEITYRIQPLTTTAASAPALLPASPIIAVTVQKLAPVLDGSGNPTTTAPSCANTGTNHDVPAVTINSLSGQSDTQSSPTSGGSVSFASLKNDSGSYKVSLTAPLGYGACGAATTTVQPGQTSPVTMKIWPICSSSTITVPAPDTYAQGSFLMTKEYVPFPPGPISGNYPTAFFGREPLVFSGPIYYYALDHYRLDWLWGNVPTYNVYNASIIKNTKTVTTVSCTP